jgi:uncharacterized protein
MKLSAYNNLVQHQDGTLLHNLISGGLIVLKNNSLNSYIRLQNGDFSEKYFVEKMSKFGFVTDDQDEREYMRKIYDNKTNNSLNKHVFIVTTDRCNLGCYYCYEEKQQWIKMSLETQEECKIFIKNMILGSKTDCFGICWFGGEPTLNMEAIENIGTFVKKLCIENEIVYEQFMVTNGTTMTENTVNKLFSLGLNRYQITVDGFKEDHDKSRPYLKDIDPKKATEAQKNQLKKIGISLRVIGEKEPPLLSSYDAIMKGIKRLVNRGAVISLRMNVNAQNLSRASLLLEDIKSQGWLKKNEMGGFVYAYTHPIFEPEYSLENKKTEGDCGSCGSCSSSNNKSFEMMSMASFTESNKSIRNWHNQNDVSYFTHYREMRFLGDTCTANRLHECVINPDGTIVKCTHHAGNPNKSIGHIKNYNPDAGFKTTDHSFHTFNPFEDEECKNCKVLPICLGGCKSINLVERELSGKFDKGCVSARNNIDYEIVQLYESKKKKKSENNITEHKSTTLF